MIKVNLLESVTDRPQGVALVEDKVASPRIQTLLLALTVFGLMALAMGYDYVSANMAYTAAQKELDTPETDQPADARDSKRAAGAGEEDRKRSRRVSMRSRSFVNRSRDQALCFRRSKRASTPCPVFT